MALCNNQSLKGSRFRIICISFTILHLIFVCLSRLIIVSYIGVEEVTSGIIDDIESGPINIPKSNYEIREFSVDDEDLECSICLSGTADDRLWIILGDCKHMFHYNCLSRWLLAKSSCPNCRNYVAIN